jgi:hypothetical protein
MADRLSALCSCRASERLEGFGELKGPIAALRIEPGIFRLVAYASTNDAPACPPETRGRELRCYRGISSGGTGENQKSISEDTR